MLFSVPVLGLRENNLAEKLRALRPLLKFYVFLEVDLYRMVENFFFLLIVASGIWLSKLSIPILWKISSNMQNVNMALTQC